MERQNQGKTWVILVPLPFQGHITPMLELGTVLYTKGFSIVVMHTKFNSPDPCNYPNFSFMPLSNNVDCQDSIIDSTKTNLFAMVLDLNVDCILPFKDFLAKMMIELSNSSDRIGCVIYDNLMCFCEDVAIDLKLPSAMLRTHSASAALTYLNFPKLQAQGFIPLQETMLEELVHDLYPLRFKDLPLSKNGSLDELLQLVEMANRKTSSPTIWNTFDLIEHPALSKLQQHFQVPFFSIGPLNKIAQSTSTTGLYREDVSCISWLDKQEPNSVLFVSFGSLVLWDEKGIEEMAWGLVNSDQPFLWVVRPGSVCGSEWINILPDNLKERVEEKGHIVKWAPQKEILAHKSVGGFLSHCGWNSTIESISEGVPIICYPCFGDQKVNARYLIHVWGLGLELGHELARDKVEKVVRILMVDEEGEGLRQRAKYMKVNAEDSLRKGGSTFDSLEKLVKFIGGV